MLTSGKSPRHARNTTSREGGQFLKDGRGDVDVARLASLAAVTDDGGHSLAVVNDARSLAADMLAVKVGRSQGGNTVGGLEETTAGDLVAGVWVVVGHLTDGCGSSRD